MPVVPMQKVAVFGHLDFKGEILTFLQKSETLEITPLPSPGPKTEEINYEATLTELKSTIDFLEGASGKRKSFIESFAPQKEIVREETLLKTVKEFDWKEKIKTAENIRNDLNHLNALETRLKSELGMLSPWQDLKVQLNQMVCTAKTCVITGTCKTKDLDELKKKLERFSSALQIETVRLSKEKVYLLIFYLSAEEKMLSNLLSKSGFEKVVLPASERTAAEEILHLKHLLQQIEEDRKKYLKELQSLLKYKAPLTYVYDYLYQKNLEKVAREKAANTEKAFILTGWIPKKKLEGLKTELAKVTPLAEVQKILPEKGETPPTLIENPPVFYPFEVITRIFGLPGPKEIDPTAALSFFYILFFAMCLSDVGYGIILSIASYYLLKKMTFSEGGKKILLLLFWGGLATIVVGVLTGSYFGLDLNTLPPSLGGILKSLQIINPIQNPFNVLILSLALGVVQNIFGLCLGLYWKIRQKDYLNAILDYGLWIFFLLSLVSLVAASALQSPLFSLSARLSIIGGILLALTQGRHEPNIFKKAIFGILSLYRTTSFLGDTLSYSRLLALMMTTSIIGMVVNIIAGLTKNSIPILGYVIMLAILIFGHAFNLIVSVLGAFIHSTRLQLVEFFGKFYEGTGREFRPFRRETKYVMIK